MEAEGEAETKIGIQGLRKRILNHGTLWQTPYPGDEVEVHYSGCIEGRPHFESSRDKGVPFRFKLGQCEVIKGLDEGVVTMKKGERAIFTVPPELAYGEVGSPPLIPPNSVLIFDIELLQWSSIRDLTGDGGVLKKITGEGKGWATPKDNDQVLVKYNARLENGELIFKSDQCLEFYVNDGHGCPAPAISKAVKTMRKAEKAELVVKFSYGFTQIGYQSNKMSTEIPSNSNLTIYLELVSWKSVIDICGNKKVLKKIIKDGEGLNHPDEGSTVTVIYTAKQEEGPVFEKKGCDGKPFEFICFGVEEQINEGLEKAILTMRKGEQALVIVRSNLLSDNEVIANSALLYEVELIDFTKEKPVWKMESKEKIEACERKKLDGNSLFNNGKFSRASKKYDKALKYIEFDHFFDDQEKSKANSMKLTCHLNNAACKLKLGNHVEASVLCTKVLELDPLNVKALYRRSQSYLRTSELEKAEADIKRALTIDPNNRDLKVEYKLLKDKQKEYLKYQAGIFTTMLSRMAQV